MLMNRKINVTLRCCHSKVHLVSLSTKGTGKAMTKLFLEVQPFVVMNPSSDLYCGLHFQSLHDSELCPELMFLFIQHLVSF
jgi:hypothetical protein